MSLQSYKLLSSYRLRPLKCENANIMQTEINNKSLIIFYAKIELKCKRLHIYNSEHHNTSSSSSESEIMINLFCGRIRNYMIREVISD